MSIRNHLYSFEKVPKYLQSNPYIRSGYRYGLNVKDCLFSLLYLNNESINIWSHLIGAGLFVYFFIRDIYLGRALPFLTSTSDYYFILFYTLSVVVSLAIGLQRGYLACLDLYVMFGILSSFRMYVFASLCGVFEIRLLWNWFWYSRVLSIRIAYFI